MQTIFDITKGSDKHPTIPLYDICPIRKKHIWILKEFGKNEYRIIGFENSDVTVMGFPLYLKEYMEKYKEMSHYAISDLEQGVDYNSFIGKTTPKVSL